MLEVRTKTLTQTEELGRVLGKILTPKDIVLLNGELGAGKTALVRGVVTGAGGSGEDVTSPSYTYLNIYNAQYQIYHFDVYLLESFDDVYELGIEELYNKGLIIIEWGGKFTQDFVGQLWEININYTNQENERQIEIIPPKDKDDLIKEMTSFGNTSI